MWKRILGLCLAVLLLSGCQIGLEEVVPNATEKPGGTEGVSLEIVTQKQDSIEILWKNETRHEVIFGEAFDIEYLEDGSWKSCAVKDMPVHEIAHVLEPNSTRSHVYRFGEYFDLSKEGSYRFVTNCTVQTEQLELFAELMQVKQTKVYDHPPGLTLVWDGGSAQAQPSSYSWNYGKGDMVGVDADCPHPLDCDLEPITTGMQVELVFAEKPTSVRVTFWEPNVQTQEPGEEIPLEGSVLTLKPGSYVYAVCAQWEKSEKPYYGTGGFCFHANVPDGTFTVDVVEASKDKLEILWNNDSAYLASYDAGYSILRLEDGQWVDCALEPMYFPTVLYVLSPGASTTEVYGLHGFDLSKPGVYRFTQVGYLNEEKLDLWAEFTL